MWRRRLGRLAAAWCIVLAVVACGPALVSPTAIPPATPTSQTTPTTQAATAPTASAGVAATATTAAATATALPASPVATSDRLYLLDTSTPTEQILALDAATGAIERALPAGVPTSDWTIIYAVDTADRRTTIRAVEVATGATLRATTIDGGFWLPSVGVGTTRVGLSRDGRTLVLAYRPTDEERARFKRENRWVSRFAVLDTTFQRPARIIELDGNYSYDALAPSSNLLYLIEHRPPLDPTGEYAVRAYDLAANSLRPGVIFDKARGEERMEGYPVTQLLPRGGGWVYTLYSNGTSGPFVHALDAANGFAICIDLPTAGKENPEAALLWSMALSSGEGTLYAVNAALGQVAEIDANGATVRRTATFAPTATAPRAPLAWLGDRLVPRAAAKRAITNGAALSADGATLYVLGDRGIVVIDTRSLRVTGRLATESAHDSLALSQDAARLYTIGDVGDAPARTLALRHPTTGAILRQYGGAGQPWAILRVEARR